MKNKQGKEIQLGRQLTTCEQLIKLVGKRKSVYHTGWKRQCSAAWIQNMPLSVVASMIRGGMIHEYIPQK